MGFLVFMMAFCAAAVLEFFTIDTELLLGYVLLMLGYLLLPVVGLIVVRRRQLIASGLADPSSIENDRFFGDSISITAVSLPTLGFEASLTRMFHLAARSRLLSDVEKHTEVIKWDTHPSTDGEHEANETQCVVCLGNLVEGDCARRLKCGHAFHRRCVDMWLIATRKNFCPTCVRPVVRSRDVDMNLVPSTESRKRCESS